MKAVNEEVKKHKFADNILLVVAGIALVAAVVVFGYFTLRPPDQALQKQAAKKEAVVEYHTPIIPPGYDYEVGPGDKIILVRPNGERVE